MAIKTYQIIIEEQTAWKLEVVGKNYSEAINIRTFGVLLLPINTNKNEIGSKKLFSHPLIYWLLKCCGLTCNFSRQ